MLVTLQMILHLMPVILIFDELLMHSEHESALAECWFESNCMKLNTDKCYLIISGNKHESFWADIGNDRIWESNYVKLLGINICR